MRAAVLRTRRPTRSSVASEDEVGSQARPRGAEAKGGKHLCLEGEDTDRWPATSTIWRLGTWVRAASYRSSGILASGSATLPNRVGVEHTERGSNG